jgi:LmbE family N-acetylglucosaminyl deacetylase
LTSTRTEPRATVLLLGHQDDEFGVLPLVAAAAREGERLCAIYCTSNPDPERENTRQRESRKVLTSLGVAPDQLRFLGAELNVPDGECFRHLARLLASLTPILNGFGNARTRLLVPAWEGGHHDHDAVHALGVAASAAVVRPETVEVHQFPLYTAALDGRAFRVMWPRPENGPVHGYGFGLREGLRTLAMVRHYRSQWRSFAGLLPGAARHYLLTREIGLQETSIDRTKLRPHAGTLFYERRFGVPYAKIADSARELFRLTTK